MTTTLNGSSRPSLAKQIDRLDNMLDGLSEGLTEAVADAVKIAVGTAAKEAIQTALVEVLTNPEVMAKLNTAQKPPLTAKVVPSLRERFTALLKNVRTALQTIRTSCTAGGRKACTWMGSMWQRTTERVGKVWQMRSVLKSYKWQLITAVGVGTTIAVGAWFAGPHLAAMISGIGGFCTTLAIHGWLWLRRTFGIGVG